MPSWNVITKEELDTELNTFPEDPDFDESRPITVNEIQGSLEVSWPSTLTRRRMKFYLYGDRTMVHRKLTGGTWTPLVLAQDFWHITQVSSAVSEPRLLDVRDGSAPLLRLVAENAHNLLLFRTDNGIFALGYGANAPFYAQYN